jgi:hypothetical protein
VTFRPLFGTGVILFAEKAEAFQRAGERALTLGIRYVYHNGALYVFTRREGKETWQEANQ